MTAILGPLLVAGGFGLYMATNVWLGRFRRNPWEFFALSLAGAVFAVAHAAATPSRASAAAAAVSVVGVAALYWFWYSFSMYGAREDRPRVGDRFPAFRLPTSDGGAYDSAALRGTPRLYIFYRGSW
jgi:hypothetical protein